MKQKYFCKQKESPKNYTKIRLDELKEAIERYIKYYNEKRIKEKLGWMSPVQYQLNTLAA